LRPELGNAFYSIPQRFARSEVEVRLIGRTGDQWINGERAAPALQQ
jgi:hypothetical protein